MSNTVLPLVPPSEASGHRLMPALLGTFDRHQVAFIECPAWCVEDHMSEPSALEDLTHHADSRGVEVSSFVDSVALAYALWARLEASPASTDPRMRGAHVLVWEDAGSDEARLTADMAEEFADDLVGFAAHLRQLARTVRLANHEAPAERAADEDEAVRRSVDQAFPAVAAFLADERGGEQ